ncbi:flagellar hook-associated protein FlgK [Isachenkonia alkalipeptolytica]|uniref:Flagellar hook-associated protein 1 n=1 Tax=Isachenkonia alkalipeptolytica TaxID=2565777 RepID=A0AA44BEK7_9CLOT|nr:flagellar hook-associated protein FlgK [Isachenkonia alkalipeptolytica]NBG88305.1 flagellar hook-associated protein FlgK [Isachenkonia alkalipeptolytica]
MRSTFLGFNAARSGLFSSQRALDITGHNIANANTEGYSRQRLEQSSSISMKLQGGQGMLGTGVDTKEIQQIRNEFIDHQLRQENTDLGYWGARAEGLEMLEMILNEPSDTGITEVMDDFFYAVDTLAKNPGDSDITVRAQVREEAIAFTKTLNHLYSQMEQNVRNTDDEINNTVTEINDLTKGISRLNKQIYTLESDGSNANDLRDDRNVMLDELSKLADVRVSEYTEKIVGSEEGAGKKMMIEINGRPLVDHDTAYAIETEETYSDIYDGDNPEAEIPITQLTWAGREELTGDLGGELQALVDLRDGDSAGEKGYPYYMKELNTFAQTFAKEVNELHSRGYGLGSDVLEDENGNPVQEDGAGYLMFTRDNENSIDLYEDGEVNYKEINARNISISADVDEDLNRIATSLDGSQGDASIAEQIGQMRNDRTMFQEGKPEDFMKALIGNLGVDAKEANRNRDNQEGLVGMLDYKRESIMGVSMDEEMSNMIKFQHAYNASARMMTTMDEMLDVVINRLGTVGR